MNLNFLKRKKKENNGVKTEQNQNNERGLKIKFPNCKKYVPIGKSQVNRIYKDDLGGRLLIVVDECAELLEPSGVKTTEGKEEDAMKQEITGIMQSITQLGRSAGIHMIICTQRNDARIIPGVIQNNPLAVDTKITVQRNK